jgi:DHA1 family inner membrane transport protein
MRKPLLALAVSAFGIGTSEFIIMGLLPDLAHSFRVSIPKTGILVSGYALSVTLGSPLVALALSRMDRKRALLILMGMFVGGNALCALAPTFLLLLWRAYSPRFVTVRSSVSAALWLLTWFRAPSGPRQLRSCSPG